MVRKMLYRPSHPLAGRTGYLSKARHELWNIIGLGPHKCHWCDSLVNWMVGRRGGAKGALITDHLDGNPLNDHPDNLVPSCHTCNSTRQRSDLITEGEPTLPNGKWRVRAETRHCAACKETFLFAPSKFTKKNAGTYCSKRCMWNRGK